MTFSHAMSYALDVAESNGSGNSDDLSWVDFGTLIVAALALRVSVIVAGMANRMAKQTAELSGALTQQISYSADSTLSGLRLTRRCTRSSKPLALDSRKPPSARQ